MPSVQLRNDVKSFIRYSTLIIFLCSAVIGVCHEFFLEEVYSIWPIVAYMLGIGFCLTAVIWDILRHITLKGKFHRASRYKGMVLGYSFVALGHLTQLPNTLPLFSLVFSLLLLELPLIFVLYSIGKYIWNKVLNNNPLPRIYIESDLPTLNVPNHPVVKLFRQIIRNKSEITLDSFIEKVGKTLPNEYKAEVAKTCSS